MDQFRSDFVHHLALLHGKAAPRPRHEAEGAGRACDRTGHGTDAAPDPTDLRLPAPEGNEV
jgi:hypothetical protein